MRSDILPWILIISLYCVGLGLASDLYHYFLSFIFFSGLLSPLSFLSAFFSPPPPAVCVVPVSFGGFFRLTRSSLLWSLPSSHRSRLQPPPCPPPPTPAAVSRHLPISHRSQSGSEVAGSRVPSVWVCVWERGTGVMLLVRHLCTNTPTYSDLSPMWILLYQCHFPMLKSFLRIKNE